MHNKQAPALRGSPMGRSASQFAAQTFLTLKAQRNPMTCEDKESQRIGLLPLITTDVNLLADTKPRKIKAEYRTPKERDSGQVRSDVQRRRMSLFQRGS